MPIVRYVAVAIGIVGALACAAAAQHLPQYVMDPQGRIESVTTAEGTTTYAYYGSGQIREVRRPDGTRDSFREDPDGGPGLANPLSHAGAARAGARTVLSSSKDGAEVAVAELPSSIRSASGNPRPSAQSTAPPRGMIPRTSAERLAGSKLEQ